MKPRSDLGRLDRALTALRLSEAMVAMDPGTAARHVESGDRQQRAILERVRRLLRKAKREKR